MTAVVKCGEHLLPVRANGLCISCESERIVGATRRLRQPCPHGQPDTLALPCAACAARRRERATAGAAHVRAAAEQWRADNQEAS